MAPGTGCTTTNSKSLSGLSGSFWASDVFGPTPVSIQRFWSSPRHLWQVSGVPLDGPHPYSLLRFRFGRLDGGTPPFPPRGGCAPTSPALDADRTLGVMQESRAIEVAPPPLFALTDQVAFDQGDWLRCCWIAAPLSCPAG